MIKSLHQKKGKSNPVFVSCDSGTGMHKKSRLRVSAGFISTVSAAVEECGDAVILIINRRDGTESESVITGE